MDWDFTKPVEEEQASEGQGQPEVVLTVIEAPAAEPPTAWEKYTPIVSQVHAMMDSALQELWNFEKGLNLESDPEPILETAGVCKRWNIAMNKAREVFVAPHRSVFDGANDLYRPIKQKADQIDKTSKRILSKLRQIKEQERRRLAKEQAEAQQALQLELDKKAEEDKTEPAQLPAAAPPPVKEKMTSKSGVTGYVRKDPRFRIVNKIVLLQGIIDDMKLEPMARIFPDETLTINEAKLNQLAKAGKKELPGCEWYMHEIDQIRA